MGLGEGEGGGGGGLREGQVEVGKGEGVQQAGHGGMESWEVRGRAEACGYGARRRRRSGAGGQQAGHGKAKVVAICLWHPVKRGMVGRWHTLLHISALAELLRLHMRLP